MQKTTSEELIDLLYQPMTSDKMIEAIDALGMEQPIISEEYEMGDFLRLIDTNGTSGVSFTFTELDGYSQDGELILYRMSFGKDDAKVSLPYGLKINFTAKKCIQAVGSNPNFIDDEKECLIWIKETSLGIKYSLAVVFWDDEQNGIMSVNVLKFDENKIDKTYSKLEK